MHLAVYDVTGRERVVLVDAVEQAWDGRWPPGTAATRAGSALPAGVYFVRLAFDGHVEAQKLVLTR